MAPRRTRLARWLYLIGANGRILDRWSSLFDVEEVARELQQLPPMKG